MGIAARIARILCFASAGVLLLSIVGFDSCGDSVHQEITVEGFTVELEAEEIDPESVDEDCLEEILDANDDQDSFWDIFTNRHPEYHFDGSVFQKGVAYIQEQWELIEANDGEDCEEVLEAFGRILHGIQDFYSHSNWVEVWVPTVQSPADIPLWEGDDFQEPVEQLPPLGPEGEEIGTGEYGSWFGDRWSDDPNSHRQMNKDNPDSPAGKRRYRFPDGSERSGFELARMLAIRHTRIMLHAFKQKGRACFQECIE